MRGQNKLSLRLASCILALACFLPASRTAAEPQLERAYAYAYRPGSSTYFTGGMMIMQAPTQDYTIPGTTPSGCVYYPLWISYSVGVNWVEIGLSKCRGGPVTDPAGYYHVYGYWETPGQGAFLTSQINVLVPTGGTVSLQLQRKDSRTWQWWVNGTLKAEVAQDAWAGQATTFSFGVEGHSPAFAPRDARMFNIAFQESIGTNYKLLDLFQLYLDDNDPYHYGIWTNGSTWDFSMGGSGLGAKTGWVGPDTLGPGQKNMGMTPNDQGVNAYKYAGEIGIDFVAAYTGADGQTNIDMWGLHQFDQSEHILKVVSNPVKVALITVADKPAPVLVNLYVDGGYVGQMSFDNNDNSRHLRIYTVNSANFRVGKAHAFAFAFANDYNQGGGPDGDRNMLLDSLATVTCTNC